MISVTCLSGDDVLMRCSEYCSSIFSFIHKDSCHWTPLHYCAQRGDALSVEYLLRHGAVDNADDCGVTARDLAEKYGHHVLLNLFPNNVALLLERSESAVARNALAA